MFNYKGVLTLIAVLLFVLAISAATITTVTKNPDPVGKYVKFELTVALGGTYTNPYDPTQIDLSAQFTSPTNKVWKVNGFYNGSQYKIRFAANETGNWTYTVSATDASGTASSPGGTFTVTTSSYHGWVTVAPNKRYLMYDDGASFYGVGSCYAWSASTTGLDQMKAIGFNTWVYWDGTYDNGVGLIESKASGVGKYDQAKCTRVDSLISWSEQRNNTMILVLLPHDYDCENMGGWPAAWSSNPYGTITTCTGYMTDASSWSYQQKRYRYIIARWGYSRGLGGWQTVDEIGGTCGNQSMTGTTPATASGNVWTGKMADFFHANDPFHHPTNSSLGNFWPYADSVNDVSNTECYGCKDHPAAASLAQQLWNRFTKPAIAGEYTASGNSHNTLWASLASGLAVTPLMWQFNQGWSAALSAIFPPFVKFISDINFSHLTNLAQATVTVSGATAYGIKSNEAVWGWVIGTVSGKSISVAGVANGPYTLTWFDCTGGTVIATSSITVSGGALSATVPATSVADIAFKAIGPGGISSVRPNVAPSLPGRPGVHYENGLLYIRGFLENNSVVNITTALGSIVAQYKVPNVQAITLPVRSLAKGVYFVAIGSGSNKVLHRILVK